MALVETVFHIIFSLGVCGFIHCTHLPFLYSSIKTLSYRGLFHLRYRFGFNFRKHLQNVYTLRKNIIPLNWAYLGAEHLSLKSKEPILKKGLFPFK